MHTCSNIESIFLLYDAHNMFNPGGQLVALLVNGDVWHRSSQPVSLVQTMIFEAIIYVHCNFIHIGKSAYNGAKSRLSSPLLRGGLFTELGNNNNLHIDRNLNSARQSHFLCLSTSLAAFILIPTPFQFFRTFQNRLHTPL